MSAWSAAVKVLMTVALSLAALRASAHGVEPPALIPLPREVAEGDGDFTFGSTCAVACDEPTDAARLVGLLGEHRVAATVTGPRDAEADAAIRIVRAPVRNPHGFAGAYTLAVAPGGIRVTTADAAGAIHAAGTLRQLLRRDGTSLRIGAIRISDWPAFPVRGFMLDTGRNFQSTALLKEQIEVMARYKLNVFHFHLTDNPGWRLESKVHPAVNDPASMTRLPGSFYCHEEFRDLVAFCRERGIRLVPELDIPGHSAALRKALGIRSMNDPATRAILKGLLTELASLATAEDMPWIHIGTDEVYDPAERVDATFLPEMNAHIRSLGREVIGWRPGLHDPADARRITQLWKHSDPLPGNPFIDSRWTYINHMDPFECVTNYLFRQPCGRPHGDDRALGSIHCSWPDIRIAHERDQLRQNPVYPAMLTFSESIWRGVDKDDHGAFRANLPPPGTVEFQHFLDFETRLLDHRRRFFAEHEFPYAAQGALRWRIIGPFAHGGDVAKSFPVEQGLRASYEIDGRSHRWIDRQFTGATVYLKHFFGFPAAVTADEGTCYAFTRLWSPTAREMPAWIGFHTHSRSERRGISTVPGAWHASQPWIRLNGQRIPPPKWAKPAPAVKGPEIPFTDEDYFYRPPTVVPLRQGWNEILVKIPHRKGDWKWMFTFAPVGDTRGLRCSTDLESPAEE